MNAPIIPCLRYRDAPKAIDWLCRAFGFAPHLVVPGEAGLIAHAQLTCGHGMVMLGSVVESDVGLLMRQPDEVGGFVTQSVYLVVADIDTHFARALAAGAMLVRELRDEDYGGRDYACRDPEGHLWSFGTYDPWAPAA
jgi:uncharacterized glyoxalase superfamily protein PhnB